MPLFSAVPSRGFFLSSVLGYEAIFLKLPSRMVRALTAPNALCLSSFDPVTHRFGDADEVQLLSRAQAVDTVLALAAQDEGRWDAEVIDQAFSPNDPEARHLFPFGRLGLGSS